METEKRNETGFFTEDLWGMILVRLPLRIITTAKLVCKQWKSLVESPYFRNLFVSLHQNSHSSWSIIDRDFLYKELVGYYGCKIWGLPRSLNSYVTSLITHNFETRFPFLTQVTAYTHVGLILISSQYLSDNPTYYVANPISRQCVEIPHPPLTVETFYSSGLATRTENDLGYKVVLMDRNNLDVLRFMVYSSETGLWSFKSLHSHLPLSSLKSISIKDPRPICLNGKLYWIGYKRDHGEILLSHDFYATGTESDRYQLILFPDVGITPNFSRVCTSTSQGNIMYMNVFGNEGDGDVDRKLRVWKLTSGEWQLVSEISPACSKTGYDYFPIAINPVDASTIYVWCSMHRCYGYTDLHRDKFGVHENLESSSHYLTDLSYKRDRNGNKNIYSYNIYTFVLPPWLYQIPSLSCEERINKGDIYFKRHLPWSTSADDVVKGISRDKRDREVIGIQKIKYGD